MSEAQTRWGKEGVSEEFWRWYMAEADKDGWLSDGEKEYAWKAWQHVKAMSDAEARAEQREMCGRAVFKLIMQDGLNPTRPDIAKAVCLNATGKSDE